MNGEIWRLAGLLIIAALIGLIFDAVTLMLLITVSGYLFWQMRNIQKLHSWLHSRSKFYPPDGSGIWTDIFDQMYRLQKRNRDRKKKLAAYLTRFQSSTAAMPDATIVLDEYGQIEWMNSAAQEDLRLRPQKDAGQHITNLIRIPAFKAFFDSGEYDPPLVIPLPHDDKQYVSIRIIPYGQNQRLMICRDITRIKQLEHMRRDFIANISHELRTPLTVIHGYVETMADDPDPGLTPWHPSVKLMQQQTTRMRNIVEDLLTLSRLETGDSMRNEGEVSIPAILATIREDAVALSGDKHHQINLEVDESLWLRGASNELHSAFSNLIFNAVRYTPAGGQVNIRWYGDDKGAHLEVHDTGIGIPPQHIPRLTERFYRVDIGRSRDVGGTGLGLAIVKHVTQRHKGRLRISSRLNEGSSFCCDFANDNVVRKPSQINRSA